MFHSVYQAYEDGRRTSGSSRELESALLFKAARLLKAAADEAEDAETPGGATRTARLDEALRYNQRLWTIFQSELVRPDHPMPPEMRLNLLRLVAFVDRRTLEIRGRVDAAQLRALAEIDRQIAAGLAGEAA